MFNIIFNPQIHLPVIIDRILMQKDTIIKYLYYHIGDFLNLIFYLSPFYSNSFSITLTCTWIKIFASRKLDNSHISGKPSVLMLGNESINYSGKIYYAHILSHTEIEIWFQATLNNTFLWIKLFLALENCLEKSFRPVFIVLRE